MNTTTVLKIIRWTAPDYSGTRGRGGVSEFGFEAGLRRQAQSVAGRVSAGMVAIPTGPDRRPVQPD